MLRKRKLRRLLSSRRKRRKDQTKQFSAGAFGTSDLRQGPHRQEKRNLAVGGSNSKRKKKGGGIKLYAFSTGGKTEC